jgi:sulfide:quinone oxidoreductase
MGQAKVVIVGGGVGGTFVANLLAKHSDRLEVTVVDATGVHHYQPGLLYVPFGWERPERLRHDERRLLHPAVQLLQAPVERIDVDARQLRLSDGGMLPYDFLVIATGSCPVPDEIPGLAEGSHHFYTEPAAVRLREVTLLLDDWLRRRGLRKRTEVVFVTPLPQLFSIPTVAPLFEELFARKGITVETFFNTERVEPERRRLVSLEGTELDYDLLVLIPPHQGSPLIDASALGDKGGWVPTDKFTLQMKGQERLFAIGDATDLPVSKSGAAAHFQAPILAHNLLRLIAGQEPEARYDGSVMCLVETGNGRATVLRFNYEHPPQPPRPSLWHHWLKVLLNRFYPALVPKGIALDIFLATLWGKFAKAEPFCGSTWMERWRQQHRN